MVGALKLMNSIELTNSVKFYPLPIPPTEGKVSQSRLSYWCSNNFQCTFKIILQPGIRESFPKISKGSQFLISCFFIITLPISNYFKYKEGKFMAYPYFISYMQ